MRSRVEVIFRKSDLYLVALLWKLICNLGDPMSLRHPVSRFPGVSRWEVVSHVWMGHVARTNESCHTNGVMSHVRMIHVAHWNESCRMYRCVLQFVVVCCSVSQCVADVWHDSSRCLTRDCRRLYLYIYIYIYINIYIYLQSPDVWHDSSRSWTDDCRRFVWAHTHTHTCSDRWRLDSCHTCSDR